MLKIYHAPGTRSLRVIWTCEELALPYEVVPVDFSAAYRSSPEWRAMNPVGKVPVLEDESLRIFESGAMVQYLIDRYGNGALQPQPGSPAHAKYLQWSWFAEATFARPLGEIVNHRREFEPEIAEAIAEMQARAELCRDALADAVSPGPYLLGELFSAADIMMGYSLMLTEQLLDSDMPGAVRGYYDRLLERPGFRAALAA